MKTKWILEPVAYKNNITGKTLFDHVVIKENSKHEYPLALFHIDNLYNADGKNEIFECLDKGMVVEVDVEFTLVNI